MRDISHSPQKGGKRRWLRWLAAGFVTLVLFVAAAPYVVQNPPVRDWVVDAVAERENVHAEVGGASFGWFTPLELRDVRVDSPYGEPLLRVERIRADRPWWRLLLAGQRLGTFLVQEPHVTLTASPSGWNFQGVGARRAEQPKRDQPQPDAPARRPELTAHLRETGVVVRRAGFDAPLVDVESVDATVHIRYVDGVRWLTVQPFQPMDHNRLTPEMIDNGLQLIAPVLSHAAWVEGKVSLAIDEFRLPLDRPRAGLEGDPPRADEPAARAAGRLELHAVETGLKSPVLQEIAHRVAALLGSSAPTRVRIADESVVHFELRDRQVYHEGLVFGLPEISPALVMRTSGTVGLDKSLDLRVEVPVALDLVFEGPIAQRLSGKSIELAVTGTLDDPKVSVPPEKSILQQVANLVRGDPRDGAPVAEDVIELAQEVLPAAREATVNLVEGLADTAARVRQRRAERRAARNGARISREQQTQEEQRAALDDEGGDAAGDALPPPPYDLGEEERRNGEVELDDSSVEPDDGEAEDAPRRRNGPLRRFFNRARSARRG